MASGQRKELDAKARQEETVVPGGTGGKSLEAQEHLAEGRSRGGQTRKEGAAENRRESGSGEQMVSEMGKKGGERVADQEGIDIDESKFRT